MSEMVERVARAIWHVHLCDYCSTDSDIPLSSDCCAVKAARAAIEAMREPTENMLMAGQVKIIVDEMIDGEHNYACRNDLRDAWQVMIDSALQEKAP